MLSFQEAARRVAEAVGRDSALIRALRPLYELGLDAVTLGRGYRRAVNGVESFWVRPQDRHLFPTVYEPDVYHFLRGQVRPGQVCVNMGAAIGVYALSLARWVGSGGRVVAFEPNPSSRRVLAALVRRNRIGNLSVVSDAVGAVEGSATLYRDGSALYSRLDAPNPMFPARYATQAVHVTTLDTYCETQGCAPDWIVADIEGYEVAMLEGGRRTIGRCRGRLNLVVEMHPYLWESCGTSREKLERLLDELGLGVESLQGVPDPLAAPGVVKLVYR